ncbi:MAG TPA: hypothetical protein VFR35_08195 [Actinoplanes sp.]|nr:hypothetical protein [Actinoplanes sp.]
MRKPGKRTAAVALGGVGAAGVALVALIGGPALAEAPTPAPSGSASAPSSSVPAPSSSSAARPDREAERAQRQDELATALAAELGIDKAKVAAALEKVQAAQKAKADADRAAQLKTRLDEAVKAGKLTADEAAAILKAAEAGVFPQGGPGGPGGRHGR